MNRITPENWERIADETDRKYVADRKHNPKRRKPDNSRAKVNPRRTPGAMLARQAKGTTA